MEEQIQMNGTVTISLEDWDELQQELEGYRDDIKSMERTLKNINEKYEELYRKYERCLA
jgi:chromosome segregation ATPase